MALQLSNVQISPNFSGSIIKDAGIDFGQLAKGLQQGLSLKRAYLENQQLDAIAGIGKQAGKMSLRTVENNINAKIGGDSNAVYETSDEPLTDENGNIITDSDGNPIYGRKGIGAVSNKGPSRKTNPEGRRSVPRGALRAAMADGGVVEESAGGLGGGDAVAPQGAQDDARSQVAAIAHGITQLPPDQQEAAYNQATAALIDQGILPEGQVPPWNQGGPQLLNQAASFHKPGEMPLTPTPNSEVSVLGKLSYGEIQARKTLTQAKAAVRKGEMTPEEFDQVQTQAQTAIDAKKQYIAEQKEQIKQAKLDQKMATTNAPTTKAAAEKPMKPLSADAASKAEIMRGGSVQTQDMMDLYSKLSNPNLSTDLASIPGIGKVVHAVQSDEQQKYNFMRNDLVDRIARLRTGAAFTESEAKRFERLIPAIGDSPETAKEKLKQVQEGFNHAYNNIMDRRAEPRLADTIGQSGENAGYIAAKQTYPWMTPEQYAAWARSKK